MEFRKQDVPPERRLYISIYDVPKYQQLGVRVYVGRKGGLYIDKIEAKKKGVDVEAEERKKKEQFSGVVQDLRTAIEEVGVVGQMKEELKDLMSNNDEVAVEAYYRIRGIMRRMEKEGIIKKDVKYQLIEKLREYFLSKFGYRPSEEKLKEYESMQEEKEKKEDSKLKVQEDLVSGLTELFRIASSKAKEKGYEFDGEYVLYKGKKIAKIEGTKIVNLKTGEYFELPIEFLKWVVEKERKDGTGFNKFIDNIDAYIVRWQSLGMRKMNEELLKNYEERLNGIIKFANEFEPEYRVVGEDYGKYSKKMGLKVCTNSELFEKYFTDYLPLSNAWYNGDFGLFAPLIPAIKDILDGKEDMKNIFVPQLNLLISASRIVAERFGSEYVYRGETNIERAQRIIRELFERGESEYGDRIVSFTENENLARWYAVVHEQMTPRSEVTVSNVLVRVSKSKYLDSVVFDYRVTQDPLHPEQEITLRMKGIRLTVDDVLVYLEKERKWVTVKECIEKGYKFEDIVGQMKR